MHPLVERLRGRGPLDRPMTVAALVAVVATAAAVVAFFPRTSTPTASYELRWAGPSGRVVGGLVTAPAFPGGVLLVRGQHLTGDHASVTIGGLPAGTLTVA